MAEITAAMVKDLRDKTGAGMMECRKALVEANGDATLAMENLRKSGIMKGAARAGKATKEGRIVVLTTPAATVLAEVLVETDFVARTDQFVAFADGVAKRALALSAWGDVSEVCRAAEASAITDLVTRVGESVQVRRVVRWQATGAVSTYVHGNGKIAVLVDVTGGSADFGKKLAMHVAAASPKYLRPEDVPAEVVAKEKEIAAATPELQGKPAAMLEKILDGKIKKWYTDICLTKQIWVHDTATPVEKVEAAATINRFLRWQVGEEL